MVAPSQEERAVVRELVERAVDPEISERELDEVLTRLQRLVPHPLISDLIFHNESFSVDDVVEIALSYDPIEISRTEG